MKAASEDHPTAPTLRPTFTQEERDRVYAEMEAKLAREHDEAREIAWNAICPMIYREPLDFSRIMSAHHDKIRGIVEWANYPRGLFIIGPTGRAKTRACWQAIRRQHLRGRSLGHATCFQFAHAALRGAVDIEFGSSGMRKFVAPDILFLDDLGKRMTPSLAQFLFEVVERRTSNGKAIVVTTNATPETLTQAIGDSTLSEPIIRRLKEFCDTVVLP